VKHHEALPYPEIADFMTMLRKQVGVAPRALEFAILTASRAGEALKATWDEFDVNTQTWVIPAHRMKGNREHRVPLSNRAVEILESMEGVRVNEFAFPGPKQGKPLSDMALLMTLRRMDYKVTTHGFRSTFRTWAAEQTNFRHEVAESALAHAIGNKVEAAYQRGDLFDKRRQLMTEWARYCSAT
jgi:integrase